MSKKDMVSLAIQMSDRGLLTALAESVEVKLSEPLTLHTNDLLGKAGTIAENVLCQIAKNLVELSNKPMICVKFSRMLGILPSEEECEEVMSGLEDSDMESLLKKIQEDDDVPQSLKDFMTQMSRQNKDGK